ncbi:serine/threonine-kinase-like protein [Euroglyphus maynei]|uniref:non-specific serine/threonine protein kinase n=1 Tax=Euroglyphus maynei TaxID=6958 RepID=A0A1Y3AZ66_EURMA|nr:serine/threonine-kinase-like protein [Euroglyphus maynei]
MDSLGDSWEETTTTSTTSDHANNIIASSPKTNGRKCKKIFTRGSRSASSQKSTSSLLKNSSLSAKRRSASFNQQQHQHNVRIVTPYERIRQLLEMDKTWHKEIAFGRRIGFYRFRGDIGNGNFSQVKVAIHSLTKEKVAVKILDKSRLDMKTQKMLSREIRTMETLHHPNLIRIFEVIESFSKHFLVMELAPGGELFQVISTNGRFSESEAKHFFSQILSAIDHMHQHNLIHRDIKAENVFFSDPTTVKVGDFGFSTRIAAKDELLSTFCGSPPYAAPELFRDESYRGPYVDYWALGVLLYFIVTGMMPFRAQNIVTLKKLIMDCHYNMPNHVSVECCQLITGFLQPDPLKRYTLEQARHTRWLQNHSHQPSLPKYDLKSSYAKLIKHRNSSNKSPLNDDEKETFRQLMLLGIDEQVLSDHIDKGSHSHIVATFRILMHRVLRQSIRKQSARDNQPIIDDQISPIRRSTSMSVAQQSVQGNNQSMIPTPKRTEHSTKAIQSSSNDSGKSRLQKMFAANSNGATLKSKENPSVDIKTDPSVKPKERKQMSESTTPVQEKKRKERTSDHQQFRLSRSFRTLKQLLTETNICGNITPVVQPQTINVGGVRKPHVIHKTTTLQINPAPSLWQTNPKTRGKLWRSQTTPDVSMIDGTMCIGNHHHHHPTIPCYHCDNPHYALPSNKKSFVNPVNRCAII